MAELLKIINNPSLSIKTNYFRGHADYTWDVIPGIARNKGINDIQSLLEIERKLIDNFQKKIIENKLEDLIPKIKGSYHESWILLMAAQHYGLPTRLIDFSHDKFVALEFAVADIQHLNKDGALIIYNDVNAIHENVDSSILKSQFKNIHKAFFLQAPSYKFHENNNCKLSEMRKPIQGSKFLYRDSQNLLSCLTMEEKHNDHLIVVHIPKEMKLEIIKHLIKIDKMAYDLYAGRNELDFYAAILKLQFSKLNDTNIAEFLRS